MSCDWDEHWNHEYDSTWEDEEKHIPESDLLTASNGWASRTARAARDMQNYRHGYPGKEETDNDEMLNLQFYENRIVFKPNGEYIEDILKDWQRDYGQLEENHSYIQWLFPLREMGMNWYAQPLTKREIQALKADEDAKRRFCEAYRLMLDFYGIKLKDEKTGEVVRAPNYKERFNNLNRHGHNNLRITRILKCLGELGYEHFQAPLVQFFLEETLVNKELPNVKRSVLDYFIFTVKDKKQRKELVLYAWEHLKDKGRFIWGPHKYLRYRKEKNTDRINKDNSEEKELKIENKHTNIEVNRENAEVSVVSEEKLENQQAVNGAEHTVGEKEMSKNDESSLDKNTQKDLLHSSETEGLDEGNSGIGAVTKDKEEARQAVSGAEHTVEKKEMRKNEELSECVNVIISKKEKPEGTGESSLDKNTLKELPHTSETEGVDEDKENSGIRSVTKDKPCTLPVVDGAEHAVEKKENREETSEKVTEIIVKKDKPDESKQEETGENSLNKNTQKELQHTSKTEGVDEGNSGIASVTKDKPEAQQAVDGVEHNVEKKENSKTEEPSEDVTETISKKEKQEEKVQEGTGEIRLDKNTQKELQHTPETEVNDKPKSGETGGEDGRGAGSGRDEELKDKVEAKDKTSDRIALNKAVGKDQFHNVTEGEDTMKRKDVQSEEDNRDGQSDSSLYKKMKLNDMNNSPAGVKGDCSINEERPGEESTIVSHTDGTWANNESNAEVQARQQEDSIEQKGNEISQGTGGVNLNKDEAGGTGTNGNIPVPNNNMDALESE